MQIDKLRLIHFRTYADQTVIFSDGINVITGKNAQGKTNLLEAVHYLTGGVSFRASTDRELISFGEQDAELILLGLPLHMDGRQGERAEKTIEFKHLLERRLEAAGLQLPVVLWDERLTTAAADDILSESEIPQEDRKKYIDKIAAALLLEDWLAAKQAGAAREEAAEGGLNGRK